MVEKYKREGIDIVLDSKKCIYTDEKKKKFIKQNKIYIPIVKRKGKYVIINKKGGGSDIDELKITLEKLIGKLNDKIRESTGKVNDELKKIKQELKVVLNINETLDYNKLNKIIEDYTFKIGIVLGLQSSKIKKDINILNEKIESNNAIIANINNKTTKETSYDDEDRIRRITSENNNMLSSIDEKEEQYDKLLLLEKEGNVKGKLHDDIPEKKTHNTIEDEKAIEKTKLKADIETKIKYIEQLNIELTKNEKDKKSFKIEYEKLLKEKKGFFSGTGVKDHIRFSDSITELTNKVFNIKHRIQIERKNLKDLEKHEAWNKSSPNLEKEQFLKEIIEKEELIKSLQKNHTEYKQKMDREDIFLDNYLKEKYNEIVKEKENDINLNFISEEFYPFLLENLLKRINDLEDKKK